MSRKVWLSLYTYWERIDFYWKTIFIILTIIIALIAMALCYKKVVSKRKSISVSGIVIYFSLIFISTVITRPVMAERVYNFKLIKTVVERITYNIDTRLELLFNICLLLPIGFLLALYDDNVNWKKSLCIGLIISSVIEVCQFITQRGTLELTDLMGNSIGVVLGCYLFKIGLRLWQLIYYKYIIMKYTKK